MNFGTVGRVVGASAVLLAALMSGCGSDAGEKSSGSLDKEPASATEAFARLDPTSFADRVQDPEAVVINVHIPYEGELADTDHFIPYDQIVGDDRLPQDKDREILLYCRSGRMSEESGAALQADGYTKVAHLEGGMKAWEAEGRELMHNPAHASESPAHIPEN